MNDKMFMTKCKIGNLEIPNRILMAPMGTKADADGSFNERDFNYYEERAKGGCGMIITGRVAATEKYELRSNHLLDRYHQLARLSMLVERVHRHGSKICIQIGPGIGSTQHVNPWDAPYSASAILSYYYPEKMCKPYTVDQIHDLTWSMGWTATLARRAGADAVEIHAYGGYLLDQFHSTQWNFRTDEYGGSLENRLRFTIECLQQIKEQAGADFPVIVKYTACHHMEGGREIEEGVEMAKLFEKAGADALHVDGGSKQRWHKQIPSVYGPDMYMIDDVAAVKAAVNIPVIGHGKIHSVEGVESVLKENKMDFVAMGHQMLTDPHWVNKAKSGESYDIVPCLGCNECLVRSHLGLQYSCAVNPLCLREGDYAITPVAEKKSVLVIGGGPGGMEAAIVAAERGHTVELWEKNSELGGLLLEAGAPSFKLGVKRYKDYLVGKVARSNVKVKLNKTADAEEVVKGKFDEVILATGAEPAVPPIPGKDSKNVVDAGAVLTGKVQVGKNVVVIGGGLVGCETAIQLCGEGKNVSVIEMLPALNYKPPVAHGTAECPNDIELNEMIVASGLRAIVGARTEEIADGYVVYSKDDKIDKIICDTVVMATGYKVNRTLEEALEAADIKLHVVGNAN